MEISKEIIANVFAPYFNQTYISDGRKYCLTGERLDNIQCGEKGKLILKPLSSITDEDAIEVAKLFYGYNEQHYPKGDYEANQLIIGDAKAILFKDAKDIIGKFYMCIGFLQSKGYDLPHYFLGNKTLKEAGLAIYE